MGDDAVGLRGEEREDAVFLGGKMDVLVRAADPPERYRVIQRFYRMRPNLVRRFYAGQSTFADQARILSGKQPVPAGRALLALTGVA